jgi:hypothetical protein
LGGERPACGTAFEEAAVKALITAAAGDHLAVYALAIAAGEHANRQALGRFPAHPAQPGAHYQFSLGDIEKVLANRESIILDMYRALFSFASSLNSDE